MISVTKNGVLLSKSELGFENEGVLNPAVILYEDVVHVFYRAVAKGNFSTIGYCKYDLKLTLLSRSTIPILYPQYDYEKHGIEDPRIVLIDDIFYLSYTAYDGINALGALALSRDLVHFDKKGIIVPEISHDEFMRLANSNNKINEKYHRYNFYGKVQESHGHKICVWDKNVIFFPRRIDGKLVFLHRIKPDIQIVFIDDLDDLNIDFWGDYLMLINDNILLSPKYEHEVSYIGGGCPPIETKDGWLLIYHGVKDTIDGYVYSACVALLDIDNPRIEISRLTYPLFEPEYHWELKGEVNNVCFPTGAIIIGKNLIIFYGAADEQIATISINVEELLTELKTNSKNHV
jgi:beta-1,2-mannobiose phosphorylase / 1,2-beta-oligomannan phosphorylase